MTLKPSNADRVLAALMLLLAVVGIAWWVPVDTGSGLLVQQRGQAAIGDALAPTLAFALLGMAAMLLWMEQLTLENNGLEPQPGNWREHAIHLGAVMALVWLSLTLMRWSGPWLIAGLDAWCHCELNYRQLRGDRPWKYLGFVIGGTVLMTGLKAIATRQLRARDFAWATLIALGMALFYDLPFKNLLLPPNGDV